MRPYGEGLYGDGIYPGGTPETEFIKSVFEPIVLVELFFDAGTQYAAIADFRYPDRQYRGRLLSLGQVRRAMQRNLGIYESTTLEIQLADEDALYSSIAPPVTGATAKIKLGSSGLPLSSYKTLFTGKIDNYSIANFTMTFVVRDNMIALPEYPDTGTLNLTDFPNAFKEHVGRPLPVCYGTHAVTSDDDYRNRGAWPTLYVDNTSGSKKFLVACHAVSAISAVYTNRPSVGSTALVAGTDYLAIPAGTLAGKTMAWIQFTDAQFNSKVVDFSGTSIGEVMVNVTGAVDSFGAVILNPVDVLVDWLARYCGNPTVDEDQLDAARTIMASRSYTVRGGYSQKKPTATVLQEFLRSFNCCLFTTQEGKIGASIFNVADYGTEGQMFDEARDVLRGSWSIDRESAIEGAESAQVVNRIEYAYDFHHGKESYFGQGANENSDSISRYGTKNLVLEMPWVGSGAAAADVVSRIVGQFKKPVAHAKFRTGLQGCLPELGDQIQADHANGSDGVPWSARRISVLEQTINLEDMTVELRARDIAEVTEGAWFLGDEDEWMLIALGAGTAQVTNTSGVVAITGVNPQAAGVKIGDILELLSTTAANRKTCVVTGVSTTTITVANTTWTNESGIAFRVTIGWTNGVTRQQTYGHLCDEGTGQFSNSDPGFVML